MGSNLTVYSKQLMLIRPCFISQPQAEAEHAKGVEKEVFFFWGGEDDICSSIRDFCNIDEDPENLIIFLNIPDQCVHVSKQVFIALQ